MARDYQLMHKYILLYSLLKFAIVMNIRINVYKCYERDCEASKIIFFVSDMDISLDSSKMHLLRRSPMD